MSFKSLVVFIGFLLMCHQAQAQFPFFHYFEDSLKPGYRISGNFDSIDCKLGRYQTTLPTNWQPAREPFDLERTYTTPLRVLPRRFSAIPHVGLTFSMGSNSSQQAGIAYTQRLSETQFIQLNYLRIFSNGALRNATQEYNQFDLQHMVRRQRYSSQLIVVFDGNNRSLNGGVYHDSLRTGFPLPFQEVENNSAQSIQRQFTIDWKQFLSITKDSLVKTGLYLEPEYSIRNRRYTESAYYTTYNYDSTNTNDYWERTSIGGIAGYFLHTKPFSINAGVKTTYWDFDNLVRKSDTLEVGIAGDLSLELFRQLSIKAKGYYTFVGAAGEKFLGSSLKYQLSDWHLLVKGSFKQNYPLNYQRAFYGNLLSYSWLNKQLITTSKLEANISRSTKTLPVYATLSFTNVLHNTYFLDNRWKQDTLTNVTIFQASIRTGFTFKRLFVQPSVRFQQSSIGYVPNWQFNGRIGFDGFLFKAKKLRAAIGVDLGYCSSYRLMDYMPVMDVYTLPTASQAGFKYAAMPKLHVFTQFELGFFRWFIRVENIEQLFIQDVNQEAIGYPVVPLQLRLGISWDLFN